MNAKRLFEDDDVLFDDLSSDRASHVEIRIDAALDGSLEAEPASTQREIEAANDYFGRIPMVAVSPRELELHTLDHREGFLLSRVDGVSTIETILDVCAMPAEEALEILERLTERGILMIPR